MFDNVGAKFLETWVRATVAALGEARAEIDALNVFPVPDGDTGTNMFLTMEAAEQAMLVAAEEFRAANGDKDSAEVDLERLRVLSQALVQGALLGARGNSGVILSQVLRGMVAVDPSPTGAARSSAAALRIGFAQASELAYAAVGEPQEGTMLTVLRSAAEAAESVSSDDLELVVHAGASGAAEALALTPTLLPVLADAGVVDSGGRGIVVILDALLEVITGVRPPTRSNRDKLPELKATRSTDNYDGPKYEVMYLLRMPDEEITSLREELSTLGNSLVVVGGEGLWNIHVHVDDAGAPIEVALARGKPFRIKITWLIDDAHAVPEATMGEGRSLICVAHGPGVVTLLQEDKVRAILCQPHTSTATGEFLKEISAAGTGEIILLPSDKNTKSAAEAAAVQANKQGLRVAVIPTKSIVESLAAIAVHDSGLSFDEDVVGMSRAGGSTRYGGVTVSSRAAMSTAGACNPGDILGVVEGDIREIGNDVLVVSLATVDRMVAAGGELVTIITGVDCDEQVVMELTTQIENRNPGIEVVSYFGGQPFWPMIFGVE